MRKRRPQTAKRPKGSPFRSAFERDVAEDLEHRNVLAGYETTSLPYVTEHKYLVDFTLPNGILVEAKGWTEYWENGSDRSKMLKVKAAYPDLDIRIVWYSEAFANRPIRKGAKTTNREWAEKNGFPQAVGFVPPEWLAE